MVLYSTEVNAQCYSKLHKSTKIAVYLLLLAIPMLSQARQSSGGWQVEYKGTLTFTGVNGSGPIWKKQEYATTTPGDIFDSSDPAPHVQAGLLLGLSGRIEGDVHVRLKWYGPGNPGIYLNYQIHSDVYAAAAPGQSGEAYDGFNTSIGIGAHAEDRKLIQPGKVLEHETTVHISALTSGDPLVLQCVVEAKLDGRYARIKASSIPEAYFVKGADIPAIWTVNDALWTTTIPRTANYVYQPAVAQDPVEMIGADRMESRWVGLPEGFHSTGEWRDERLPITFAGEAASSHISPEVYSFSESANNALVTGSLPFLGYSWGIESLGQFYAFGGYELLDVTVLEHHPNETSTDQVNLNYKWADGLEAHSQLQLNYLERFVNRVSLQHETIHVGTPQPLPFPNSPGSLFTSEFQPWSGGIARRVRWDDSEIYFRAEMNSVAIAAAVIGAVNSWAGMCTSLIGVGLSLGAPSTGEGDLTPDSPYAADTDFVKHEITFRDDSLREQLDSLSSNDDRMRILGPRLTWKALYLTEINVDSYKVDEYGTQGYVGPLYVRKETPISDMGVASAAKKFKYVAQ